MESPSQTRKLTLFLAILILCMSVIGSYLYTRYQTLQLIASKTLGLTLQVLSFSPGSLASGSQAITIQFNDSVDLDRFSHAFSISPAISGDYSYGPNDKVIVFTPKTPYESGTRYTIGISETLVSINGRKMAQSYSTAFSTDLSDYEVQFVKNDLSGIMMGFAAQKPIEFTIKKGRGLYSITTSIYRSDESALLQFLTYKKMRPDYAQPNDTYTIDTPILAEVNIDRSTAVQSLTTTQAEEKVSLGLAPGIYYAESVDPSKKTVGRVFLLVNTKGLLVRQDDQKAVLSGFDLLTNSASRDTMDVAFYNLENTPTVITTRTLTGVQDYPIPFDTRVDLIMGIHGNERIFMPLKVPNSMADLRSYTDLAQSAKIFLYTDRPIYKPGDTLHFRGLVREDQDALYRVPATAKTLKIWIDGSDNSPAQTTVVTDAHGNFWGDLVIPQALTVQEYGHSLSAQIQPVTSNSYYAQAYTQFSVANYNKPEFDLKADVQKPQYLGAEPVVFSVNGTYFSGSPLTNTQITYTVYSQNYFETEKAVYNTNFNLNAQGGMCGGGGFDEWYGDELEKNSATLDNSGNVQISYAIPKDKLLTSQKLTFVAKKTDATGNEILSATSTIVHAAAYNIFFTPSASNYYPNDEIVAPFYAETREGQKITNHPFFATLVSRTYTNNASKETILAQLSLTTDDQGKGITHFAAPQGPTGSYFIVVSATDEQGNRVASEKSIYLAERSTVGESTRFSWFSAINQTYLKIVSSKNSFVVGDTIRLTINSPIELDALMSLERGRVYGPKIIHLQKGNNDVDIQVGEDLSPSITVVFSFFAQGQYYTEGLALNVPAMHKLLSIDVLSDKQTYTPNESAHLTITTKDPNMNPIPAQLSLGVVDKAIYALKKNATAPIHSSFYYFRPRNTNASSSLTFVGFWGGGGGGGGGGDSTSGKLVDTLYWNPNIETDEHGTATVLIPLGSALTTWKAQVYGSTNEGFVGQGDTEFLVSP